MIRNLHTVLLIHNTTQMTMNDTYVKC